MRRGKQTQRMSQIPWVSCKPVNRIVMSVDFGCTFNRIRETILRKSWSPKLGRGGGGFTERKYSTIYIQWVLPIHFAVCLERYDGNMAIWLYGLWSKRGGWWLSGLDTPYTTMTTPAPEVQSFFNDSPLAKLASWVDYRIKLFFFTC